MKYLMFSPKTVVLNKPAEDGTGEGDGGFDGEIVDTNDDDDDDDAEGEEDEDAEGDEDGDTGDGDDPDGDEKDDEIDDDTGARAQKRIRKLLAEKKEATAKFENLQKQLEEAKKLTGDDGKAIIKAAEVSGILPGLMTKDEAQAFADLDAYPDAIETCENWLDEHERGDTFMSGNREMSYSEVKQRARKLKREFEDLKAEYGGRRAELVGKVREILTLGVAAKKAGWKPEQGKKPAGKKELTKPDAKNLGRKRTEKVHGDDFDVTDGDSLEAYMIRERRRKK